MSSIIGYLYLDSIIVRWQAQPNSGPMLCSLTRAQSLGSNRSAIFAKFSNTIARESDILKFLFLAVFHLKTIKSITKLLGRSIVTCDLFLSLKVSLDIWLAIWLRINSSGSKLSKKNYMKFTIASKNDTIP